MNGTESALILFCNAGQVVMLRVLHRGRLLFERRVELIDAAEPSVGLFDLSVHVRAYH